MYRGGYSPSECGMTHQVTLDGDWCMLGAGSPVQERAASALAESVHPLSNSARTIVANGVSQWTTNRAPLRVWNQFESAGGKH